jgi:hypothetical protein
LVTGYLFLVGVYMAVLCRKNVTTHTNAGNRSWMELDYMHILPSDLIFYTLLVAFFFISSSVNFYHCAFTWPKESAPPSHE